MQNAPSIRAWQRASEDDCSAVERGLALNAEDRPRRDIIERLTCDLHVDLIPFQTVEGSPVDGFVSEHARLAPMVDDGLVHVNGDKTKVTEEAAPSCVRSALCLMPICKPARAATPVPSRYRRRAAG